MEVEGRSGTRACGRDHLDMGCDTISRWLKTRVRHVRPVADHSGVFVRSFNPLVPADDYPPIRFYISINDLCNRSYFIEYYIQVSISQRKLHESVDREDGRKSVSLRH